MSRPELEERYLVLKHSHLTVEQIVAIENLMIEYQVPSLSDAVVVERDWPIFDHVASIVLNQDMFVKVLGSLLPQTDKLQSLLSAAGIPHDFS